MNLKYLLALVICTIFIFSCQDLSTEKIPSPQDIQSQKLSGAGLALDQWIAHRSYPSGKIDMRAYEQSFEQKQLEQRIRTTPPASDWEALGPKNIGGRTLCLAFHPVDPNVMFAGSAGGGIWKTTTAGVGYNAWQRVPTGFPVIGVPSIAIDPNDGDVIYIGTGEVYNYEAAAPGNINRITRGSYGVGILKTTDGGLNWTKSLDWNYDEMKGVQEVVINPLNSNTLFAATTDGLFRSYNAGASWSSIDDLTMAVDIEISPADTSLLLVSYGNMNSPDKGVYRSTDGGDSFEPTALVDNYTGKTLLAWSESDPQVVYASVADEFEIVGLYRSSNAGLNWTLMSTEDIPKYQGWYSHDVAVKPDDADIIIYSGVDTYRSLNGGTILSQRTYWQDWDFGQVPVGGPEGSDIYAHADVHAVYYHPTDNNTIFMATDGGIFTSADNGTSWEGRNGSYQTQQFYANFSNSVSDSLLAIGGMQDNATAIYIGDDAWVRVIGGDGMSASINADDDQIMYGSYQYLGLRRSMNGGNNWMNVIPPGNSSEYTSFTGPFELAPTEQSRLYAGRNRLYRSDNNGDSWDATSVDNVDGLNMIFRIAVSPNNPDLLYVCTAPNTFISNSPPPGKLFKSSNAGAAWEEMEGLPDHTISDIEFDPENEEVVYITYSGFGVNHLYKTENGGADWIAIGDELPDVPTNTVVVDPLYTDHIYVGNDLGVYWSNNGGLNWSLYSNGLPDATMVMHLSISPTNNKLRVATHGAGVWQTDLAIPVAVEEVGALKVDGIKVFPNPVADRLTISYALEEQVSVGVEIYNAKGQLVQAVAVKPGLIGQQESIINVSELASGVYYFTLRGKTEGGASFKESHSFVKS